MLQAHCRENGAGVQGPVQSRQFTGWTVGSRTLCLGLHPGGACEFDHPGRV